MSRALASSLAAALADAVGAEHVVAGDDPSVADLCHDEALGVPPGPEVGRLLGAARSWWMERGCVDDAEACRGRLRELAAARGI